MTSTILPRSELSADLAGWRGGDGPELLLIHGVGLTADCWDAIIPNLTPYFSVTAIDLPGHGKSAAFGDEHEPSLADYSSKIANLFSGSKRSAVFVGHSLGALIALDLAINHPEYVSAVVPLNTIFRRSDAASAAVKKRARELATQGKTDSTETLDRWFGRSPTAALAAARAHCESMLKSANPRGYAQAYKVFANSDGPTDSALDSIAVPMLCMTGSEEPNSTPAMSEALARSVSHGQAVIIDAARHMMPMTHAEDVSKHIVAFSQSKGLLNA